MENVTETGTLPESRDEDGVSGRTPPPPQPSLPPRSPDKHAFHGRPAISSSEPYQGPTHARIPAAPLGSAGGELELGGVFS